MPADRLDLQENHRLAMRFFTGLALLLIAVALITTSPGELWEGLVRINTDPSNIDSDFISVGGMGATLLNVALILILVLGTIHFSKETITGPALASILTLTGFAFFGTNLFNSLPIVAGVIIYSRIEKIPLRTLLLQAFMGTAIGPIITYLTYGIGLQLSLSLPLAILVGVLIGIIIPPLSSSFMRFHRGYNIYNVGFTAGIIGLIAVALLRLYGFEVSPVSMIDTEHRVQLIWLVSAIFVSLIFFGYLFCKGTPQDYPKLMNNSGRLLSDFVVLYGSGLTLINMGVMGFIAVVLVLVLRGPVNGPIVGAMMTIAGFGAMGKHPRNSIPVMLGSTLAFFLHQDLKTTEAIVLIIFSTTLAPVAGEFGVLAGVVAGYLNIAVVEQVLPLHGGLNLYNSGFSGGFVAAVMVPLIEAGRNAIGKRTTRLHPPVSEDK